MVRINFTIFDYKDHQKKAKQLFSISLCELHLDGQDPDDLSSTPPHYVRMLGLTTTHMEPGRLHHIEHVVHLCLERVCAVHMV